MDRRRVLRRVLPCALAVGASTLSIGQSVTMACYKQDVYVGDVTLTRSKGPDPATYSFTIKPTDKVHGDVIWAQIEFRRNGELIGAAFHNIDPKLPGDVDIHFTDGAVEMKNKNTGEDATYRQQVAEPPIDPTLVWFFTVKPGIAESCRAPTFEPIERKWKHIDCTYVGDISYKLGSRTVVGHRIQNILRDKVHFDIYDDQGMPLVWDLIDSLRFYRKA